MRNVNNYAVSCRGLGNSFIWCMKVTVETSWTLLPVLHIHDPAVSFRKRDHVNLIMTVKMIQVRCPVIYWNLFHPIITKLWHSVMFSRLGIAVSLVIWRQNWICVSKCNIGQGDKHSGTWLDCHHKSFKLILMCVSKGRIFRYWCLHFILKQ